MNPGKRRKLQKIKFILNKIEENKKKFVKEEKTEEVKEKFVEKTEEVLAEVVAEEQPVVEVKTTKKKK